jgi:hypothetical protein
MSHSRAVPSPPAVARILPSGLNATPFVTAAAPRGGIVGELAVQDQAGLVVGQPAAQQRLGVQQDVV